MRGKRKKIFDKKVNKRKSKGKIEIEGEQTKLGEGQTKNTQF